MTNNSIFTRVLSLVLCVIMFAGVLTSCFQMPEFKPTLGTHNHTTPNGGTTTKDHVDNEPTDDPIVPDEPVDPNELYSGSTTLANSDLIYGTLANDVFIGGEEGVAAMIPADVKVEAGASSLSLSIKKVEEETLADTLSNLDVHILGIALDNTVPMTVMLGAILPAGLGLTELKLYHIENGTPVLMTRVNSATDFAIHNQYVYDAETGNVTIYVSSFSVFTAVQTTADVWDGEAIDTSWYNENDTEFTLTTVEQFIGFRALVDGGNTFEGKTVKLATDIDLNNKLFNPIGFGYWYEKNVVDGIDTNTVFMGTFDGGNHTIYNLYENCWELDPDKTNYGTYTYSTAGAGLFASIKDATIKNIAISGAEVVFECVDMGVLVGYAQGECHFENIVITNANIANYNRYTGGLVGEVSYGVDTNEDGYSHTFKNITIDSTVTVSGLWGSFGCGMGGVIGGKWGEATVLMENVVSAPVMDVYNDVVSAYQWYAFRGCGMLIGHTEEPYSDGRHSGIATANFLTCQNVKVYYGEWVNYTYYEFENQDNATGRNYPWVRAEAGVYCDAFSNIRYGVPTHNGVKVSDLTEEELKAVATDYTPIIFNQLYGADRGMYGQEAHDGVTVINKNTKTIYIYNNSGWENLKLHYWYRHGDDTWTNHDADGIDMSAMYLPTYNVYKIELPAYADGFRIVADNENSVEFTLADLEDGETYTVSGEMHEHNFGDSNKCDCGAYKIQKWELITDTNDLAVDDQIIIVAVDANYAISIEQAANNRTGFAIVRNPDGTITITENVQILTLVAGTTEGTFGLYTGEGYLYAATAGSNHLKTQTTNNVNGDWTITITDGVASIIAEGSSNRNVMQYNPNNNSPIFSCYASASQKAIAIYKLSASEEIMEAHDCKDYAIGANCEDNATCTICGEVIENSALDHNYETVVTEATCTKGGYTTHTCSRCGDDYVTDETEALGHTFDGDSCSVCGEAKPEVGGTKTYTFSNYTAGTQYAKGEEHELDEHVTITTYDCHFTDELRIYSSSTNNGYAIIYSVNPISTIGVNAGNKVDTINIYGSNDGVNWSETTVGTISVTSTSYKDYEVSLNGEYKYIKLDVAGSNQIRIKSMTLTTGEPCEHNYNSVVTNPTCTENGYTTYTCTECGYSYTDNTVTAGHSYNSEVTTEASCTTTGVKTYTCTVCDDAYTEEIAALGHTTENGICDNCGEQIGGTVNPDPEPDPKPVEETYSYTFTSKQFSANGTKALGDVNWELTGNGGYWGYDGTKGQQFGSSGSPYKSMTLTSASFSNVSKIIVNTSGASSINAKLNVYVGDTLVKTITLTASATEYTIDVRGLSGTVKFEYTQTSSKAIYLKSIVVTYTTSSGNEGGEDSGETECTHSKTTTTTVDATCTTAGSRTVTCDACGETVSAEVIEATGHSFVNGKCNVCQEDDPDYEGGETEPEPVEATLSFADKAQRTSYSTSKQIWEQNGITFTNEKSSSTNNVADYANPVRLYANSNITINAPGNITTIVFDCNSSSYATALKNSIGTVSGATVTVNSDKVTVEFTSADDSFTIAKLSAQVRLDSITVTYTK